mgnify:FL=1
MKLGSGNSMHRRARGGGIAKGAWAPHDDPSGSGWADPINENQINYQKNIIPVLVNVIQDWVTDDNKNRVLSENSGAITKEFVQSCISDVNSMLQGTYQPIHDGVNAGQLGPSIDHELHGVACNYQLALANYIPVNYFDNWLYKFDNCVRTPENTKKNSETNGFGVKTPISFDIQSITSGGNSIYQTEFNAAKTALTNSRNKAASNYSTYTNQDMLDIKNYGGLIKTDGVLFYDAEHYYNPTNLVAARTAVGDADATAVDTLDPYNALYLDLANGTTNSNQGNVQISCQRVTNAFPGLVIWIYDAGSVVNFNSRGQAWFPQHPSNGHIWMQGGLSDLFIGDSEDIDYQNTRSEFIGTLLHEFGHCFGLRHSFDGGTVISLKPTLQAGSIKRNVIPIVQTPAVNETIDVSPDNGHLNSQQVDVDTTFDVTKYNTLSDTEKGFIEYYYKRDLELKCNLFQEQYNKEMTQKVSSWFY